ncbi:MAG: hypothetical protein AABW92_02800, partial [Nanoarchaeota archaeon]
MVFEELINPLQAESHPKAVFIHSILYVSLGLFLALWIFEDYASLVMIFLTTMAAIPLVERIIRIEEKKDLSNLSEMGLLKEHSKALRVFMAYFFGATLAFAIWYVLLPADISANLFTIQEATLTGLGVDITGKVYSQFGSFLSILSNNLKVLLFCLIFSFLYGSGAIFILTWNASVIGAAMGITVLNGLAQLGLKLHSDFGLTHISVIFYGLLRYTLHGIPEILAYFVAGLGGGIISVAAIRH